MKRILSLLICICISVFNVIPINAREDIENSNGNFAYYSVPNKVFDEFLNDVNNIEYLKEFSDCITVKKGDGFFYGKFNSGALLNMGIPDYLSEPQNLYNTLYKLGLKSLIHNYVFFTTPNLGDEFLMPVSIWLNTDDGVKFATIRRVRGNESNFFGAFRVEVLEANKYIEEFSLKPAKMFIYGEEKNFSYTKVRNNGANLGLRELMESVGVRVVWDENDNSVSLFCPENINPGYGINLRFEEYLADDELYLVKAKMITPESKSYDNDLTDYIAMYSFRGKCVLKMIDDRTIVDNLIAQKLINMLLATSDDLESNDNFYSLVVYPNENSVMLYYDDELRDNYY